MCDFPACCTRRVVHPKTLGSTLDLRRCNWTRSKFPNAQVIVKGNLVGVVAPTEWEAIQAAQQVAADTKWTEWKGLPGNAKLYQLPREEADWKSHARRRRAKPARATSAPRSRRLRRSFPQPTSCPYMKHAPIGPTMAVGDVTAGRHRAHPHAQSESAGAAGRDCDDARHSRSTTSSCASTPGPATTDDRTAATPAPKTRR